MATRRIAAVMTVFNRKEDTLRCLRSLDKQEDADFDLTVFVVDDASSDGTPEAIEEQFPSVRLLAGDGNLYWNGGMRKAFRAALSEGFDFYWWLNDDVELDHDALARLLQTYEALSQDAPVVVTGTTRDPLDGQVNYGGVEAPDKKRPFNFRVIEPADVPLPAESMNGNCVVFPKAIAHDLGNITDSYRQKMGDYDYGLRVSKAGYEIWVAPGTHGSCDSNFPQPSRTTPLTEEIRKLWSIKELPFGPWAAFTRRWGGRFWPVYFVSPYIRRSLALLIDRLNR